MCRFTWSAPKELTGEFYAKLVTKTELPENMVTQETRFTLPGKANGSTTMPAKCGGGK